MNQRVAGLKIEIDQVYRDLGKHSDLPYQTRVMFGAILGVLDRVRWILQEGEGAPGEPEAPEELTRTHP